MATATIHKVSTEAIQEAIIALIKENNAEFQQLLDSFVSKKNRKQQQNTPIQVVKKERVPYHEMPFWKAHPDLKPINAKEEGYGMTLEAFREFQAFFKEPANEITEKWLEMLD